MKFIILLSAALLNLLFGSLAIAGCTNLSAGIDITNPDSIYTDNGDSTITDSNTGLMWQKCPLGLSGTDCNTGTAQQFNWRDALIAGNTNAASGYDDWRVPNKNELSSLVEYACVSPAINESFFPGKFYNITNVVNFSIYFWTSTPSAEGARAAWIIKFDGGSSWSYDPDQSQNKYETFLVRLVRGTVALDAAPTPSQPPT